MKLAGRLAERIRGRWDEFRSRRNRVRIPPGYVPSEQEPFMNSRQLEYFRLKLLAWRQDILQGTKTTLSRLQKDHIAGSDPVERAQAESDRAIELRDRDRQRKLIDKIDAALRRIQDGTYGYCQETGEPIGIQRLEARPVATLSVEAQQEHEQRERTHSDDPYA